MGRCAGRNAGRDDPRRWPIARAIRHILLARRRQNDHHRDREKKPDEADLEIRPVPMIFPHIRKMLGLTVSGKNQIWKQHITGVTAEPNPQLPPREVLLDL